MAQEIREFAVTVPAGTPLSAPVTVPIRFPERIVRAVSYRVPPGPSGRMGWALTSAGTPVIPIQPGAYIVTDNQADTWQLEGYLDSGNWAVTAYNTGVYPHTVYLTFQLDLTGTTAPPLPPPSGTGVGVIGSGGTVSPVPPTEPPPPGTATPPVDQAAAVLATVLTAASWSMSAAAG